ncbi:MAG: THUMP domain-containing protein [Chloroflexota bacterium]|nr:THUMP domain-containing protein [Chloroflexota bacterium]
MPRQNASHLYVLTAAADYLEVAVGELRRVDPTLHEVGRASEEIVVVESALDLGEMYEALQRQEPIFLRHIAPAQLRLELMGDKEADLAELARETMAMPEVQAILPDDRFSVQARVVTPPGEDRPFTPYAIAQAIAPAIEEAMGATVDVRSPEIVISVLATSEEAFVGVSPVIFNLSDWAGGERRFRREENQISRSEFKLLEALEVFDVTLPESGRALDLGAAPGGWVRVLLDAGLLVTAVDPAELDPAIARNKRVRQIRGYAQEWIAQATAEGLRYDVILSDMRMDARDATRLMIDAASLMHLDSFALLTLKLPSPDATGMDPVAITRDALEELRSRFRTVRARQLFHNRNEVTAYLKL